MKGLFLRSLENKEKIIIYYMDQNNQVSQRYVRVLRINQDSILAFCYWRKTVRTFKLDNILTAGAISKKAGA
jgi:predicted DNA-binding transcriptional regulator YafY